MKRIFSIILAAALLSGVVACSVTRTPPTAADQATAMLVDKMLSSKLYKIDFSRAYPMTGRPFNLNYPYYLSVIGDRVESFLPYFGRSYSIAYGGGEGLDFEAPITGYEQTMGRKGQCLIEFNAQTYEDNYTFNLTIFPSGEVSLNVMALQRQSISFTGQLDFEPDFEMLRLE